jgi:hypothetical protein
LGFYLDTLEEELLSIFSSLASKSEAAQPQPETQNGHAAQEDGPWLEVGKRNRTAFTRTVGRLQRGRLLVRDENNLPTGQVNRVPHHTYVRWEIPLDATRAAPKRLGPGRRLAVAAIGHSGMFTSWLWLHGFIFFRSANKFTRSKMPSRTFRRHNPCKSLRLPGQARLWTRRKRCTLTHSLRFLSSISSGSCMTRVQAASPKSASKCRLHPSWTFLAVGTWWMSRLMIVTNFLSCVDLMAPGKKLYGTRYKLFGGKHVFRLGTVMSADP